eukprot:Amastigsp_a180661_7.p3 type:complete len:135 gc:universal Amastigsp_a180661_7:435-839(+)
MKSSRGGCKQSWTPRPTPDFCATRRLRVRSSGVRRFPAGGWPALRAEALQAVPPWLQAWTPARCTPSWRRTRRLWSVSSWRLCPSSRRGSWSLSPRRQRARRSRPSAHFGLLWARGASRASSSSLKTSSLRWGK